MLRRSCWLPLGLALSGCGLTSEPNQFPISTFDASRAGDAATGSDLIDVADARDGSSFDAREVGLDVVERPLEVGVDVLVDGTPSDVRDDGSIEASDVRTDVPVDHPIDAPADGMMDAPIDLPADGPPCGGPRPRLIAPISGSMTGASFRLRWERSLALGTYTLVVNSFARGRPEVMRWRLTTTPPSSGSTSRAEEETITSGLPRGAYRFLIEHNDAACSTSARSQAWTVHIRPRRGATSPQSFWGTVPDFDDDGLADVLVRDVTSRSFSEGPRGFWVTAPFETPASMNQVTPIAWPSPLNASEFRTGGDFFGEGRTQLLLRHFGGIDGYVPLIRGSSTMPMTRFSVAASGLPNGPAMGVGDFNGDGYADLLVSPDRTPMPMGMMVGRATVVLGGATGSPRSVEVTAAWDSLSPPRFAPVGDVDNDRLSDLIAHDGRIARVFFGTTSSSPTVLDLPSAGSERIVRALGAGDFDGDGKPDVALITAAVGSRRILIYQVTRGDATLLRSQEIRGATITEEPRAAAVGDFTGDDRDDLAVWISGTTGLALIPGGPRGMDALVEMIPLPFATPYVHDIAGLGEAGQEGAPDGTPGDDIAVLVTDRSPIASLGVTIDEPLLVLRGGSIRGQYRIRRPTSSNNILSAASLLER